ncbi:MAG: hypothetical protein ABJ215_01120 [Alphaproteobacteria bacterium]
MTDAQIDVSEAEVPVTDGPAESWRAELSEDYRDHPVLARFADVEALAREHVNLQKLIGRKGIVPPGADADDAERARFHDALGRPARPDDYNLDGLERPDGMPWDEDFQTRMLERMHASGLTDGQARALLEGYVELQGAAWQDATAAQGRALDAAETGLRREWGESFDARIDVANRAFAAAFGDRVDDVRQLRLADGQHLGDHPDMVRAFAKLGSLMGEDEFVGGKEARIGHSSSAARAELSTLEADPEFRTALLDRAHPEHRQAVARRSDLARAAYGGDAEAFDE